MPTQQALRHLDRAFRNFFAGRAKYPAFHKKHGPQAAEYTTSAFRWDAEARTLTLAKMDAPLPSAGRARARRRHAQAPSPSAAIPPGATSSASSWRRRSRPCHPSRARRARSGAARHGGARHGREGRQSQVLPPDEQRWPRRSAVWPRSNAAPRTARRPAAKWPASTRASPTVASDFLHKLSTRIIRENQTICVESLRVKAMVKHPTLAKAIHDVGWGEFVRQLAYKAAVVRAHAGRHRQVVSRAASAAPPAGMCSIPSLWRRATGRVRSAAVSMTVT